MFRNNEFNSVQIGVRFLQSLCVAIAISLSACKSDHQLDVHSQGYVVAAMLGSRPEGMPNFRFLLIGMDDGYIVLKKVAVEAGHPNRFHLLSEKRIKCDADRQKSFQRFLAYFSEDIISDKSMNDGPYFEHYLDGKRIFSGWSQEIEHRYFNLIQTILMEELN